MMASLTSLSRPSGVKATFSRLQPPAFTRTVRFRLTVWYSSLLLVFGIAFVVALNVALRLDPPGDATIDWRSVENVRLEPVTTEPGQAVGGARPTLTMAVVVEQAEAQMNSINAENIQRLQTWSMLAVVGLALASGVGGYMLSGMMLRPVRDITDVASTIGATNLNERINHSGPDDELKQLADTFDSMIARLESSFESQRRFVQYASHELRTPLAAIRTNIEVTEMDPDVSTDEYRTLMETVKTQTDRLTRLSDDLLLLTSTEAEPPPTGPVDVSAITGEAVDQLAGLADRRGTRVHVQDSGSHWAVANSDLLYRCVFNLVDNAIKYSGENGDVTVQVSANSDEVHIDVTDTGPGIAEEHQARVFDRFFRVDKSLSRRAGGSGLGLAIVRELVEVMGGSVGLQSTPGRGSTFSIVLRRSDSDSTEA